MSRDITLLIAHPDDEALFAWPVLDRVKRIVCASNDAFNPERAWCKGRGTCLADVGRLLGCEIVQLPHSSEFYRMPTRNGELKALATVLAGHLRDAETVFVHNQWGEYGNIDHMLCHHIARTVQAETGCELLVSDIAVTKSPAWLPITPWHPSGERNYDGTLVSGTEHEIDRPLYDRIKGIYDARGCWTWSFPVVEKCRVYNL